MSTQKNLTAASPPSDIASMLVQALIEDEMNVIKAHEKVQRQRAVVQGYEEKVARQKAALACLGITPPSQKRLDDRQ